MEFETTDYVDAERFGFVKLMEEDTGVAKTGIEDDITDMEGWIESMAADCDLSMSDVTSQTIASAVSSGDYGSSTINDSRTGFAALDREILAILTASGGSNGSSKNASWSRRRFDEWRLQNGMATSVPFENMDIKELADILPTFFRQVVKHNGDRYPLESLLGFYRGFTCIMQKAQESRVCETRVVEKPFCMKSYPIFRSTGVAFLEAMRRSVLAGANKGRKNTAVISWTDEQAMLDGRDHQPSHPYGCFRRWAYYCISRFAIRSGKELYNVMDFDFQERVDENGTSVVYGERLLKNNEVPLATVAVSASVKTTKRAKLEPLRVAVQCHEPDVIHTYRQFMKHQPVKVDDEIGKPRHLFLQPIGNPVTNAWFAKAHVSERVLISMFKTMAVTAGISLKDISRKIGRPTSTITSPFDVSRMMGSRSSVTAGIAGNRVSDRYGADADAQVNVLQLSDAKNLDSTVNKRNFQDIFLEADNSKQNLPGDCSLKSVPSSGNGPHLSGPVVCEIAPSEGVLKSDQHLSDNLDTKSRDQDMVMKLQLARRQLKNLELTLFGKMSHSGQSLHDLVQVAMTQLQGLESTLSSMR